MNLSEHIELLREDYGSGIQLRHGQSSYVHLECEKGIIARIYTIPTLSLGWLIKTPLALTNEDYNTFLRLTTSLSHQGIAFNQDRLSYVRYVRDGHDEKIGPIQCCITPHESKTLFQRIRSLFTPRSDTFKDLV